MATRVKRVTVVAGRAVHVDHRARLRDLVDGLHNISRRVILRVYCYFRRAGQTGNRTGQILRDDGRADSRRPWHDRHWAGPATAAADPWQGSDGAVRRSRHWVKSKNPKHPASEAGSRRRLGQREMAIKQGKRPFVFGMVVWDTLLIAAPSSSRSMQKSEEHLETFRRLSAANLRP